MKFNKWTVGLAAVGAISVVSVAKAEEKASPLSTVSSTILSGYVDTSMQWNLGEGNSHAPAYKYGGASKADGFNLNVVKITLEKPLDESEWAAGYKADFLFGPDANTFGSQSTLSTGSSDFAIKQAYVALRAPIGNGIDFKVGVFDSIVGYESTESVNNPNFTRSWAHTFEPSTHTGLLATYRVNNLIAISGGVADTMNPTINGRTPGVTSGFLSGQNESSKTYMVAAALTAPDSWGFISGSSLYAGYETGFRSLTPDSGSTEQIVYVGGTIATPITGLRVGGAFDYIKLGNQLNTAGIASSGFNSTLQGQFYSLYSSYQLTEKMSVHGRMEFAHISPGIVAEAADAAASFGGFPGGIASKMLSGTVTVQYDLWKNVLTRGEFRWDHALDGSTAFGGTGASGLGTSHNSYELLANVVYKF